MTSVKKPKVTVRISAYNHQDYVEKSILSIINQSYGYENIELIVIDDCSTDNTGKILLKLSDKYNFMFIRNEQNKGVVKNINTMIKLSTGKYIAGCASDDYWHPYKLEKQVSLMETLGEDYGVCHTSAYIIDDYEHVKFIQDRGRFFQDSIFPRILIDNGIVAPSAMLRRSVFNDVGFYDENLLFEDREMWIRLSLNYKFVFIDEPLVFRRQHVNNLSRNTNSFYKVNMMIFNKYRKYYEDNDLVTIFHYNMFNYMSGTDYNKSVYHLKEINCKMFFQWRTAYILVKLLTPKLFITNELGLRIRKILKKW